MYNLSYIIFSEHGFIKKVLLPFLLGLKFKASVLVPLALALIALKTWKALTLGLISLVLSGKIITMMSIIQIEYVIWSRIFNLLVAYL